MYIKGIAGYLSKFEGVEVDAAVERTQTLDAEFATKVDKTTEINGIPINNGLTLEAGDIGALPASTRYGYSLAYSTGVLSLLDQNGVPLSNKYVTASASWGTISGDITNQEDLISLLSTKASLDGNNTFTGEITFSSTVSLGAGATATTPDSSDNSSRIATTAFVKSQSLASSLADLIDTAISSPQNGNLIHYDSTSSKWVNFSLASTDITSALGYTPYNASNPSGFINSVSWGDITGSLANQTDLSNALNNKQSLIDSSNKLSADLIDDTNTTNKFATATQLSQISTNASNISSIQSLIPIQATSSNPLADREFVNSSISTNTANFIGTFSSIAELEAFTGTVTNNDYAFVVNRVVTDNGNDWSNFSALDSYNKALLTNFDYAWVINGSNFNLYRFNIVDQEWVLRAEGIAKDSVSLNTAYNRYKATVSGSVVTWTYEYTLNNSSFTASQWASINSGITDDDVVLIGSALQPGDNISKLVNDAGYITGITSPDVITALGYTPYNGTTNPNGYISDISSTDVITALGYTPYNGTTNPSGFISGITSSMVTTALGYTPYNGATNPNNYISSASISTLTDVSLTSLSNGQGLIYNSISGKWENGTISSGVAWGNITGTLASQADLYYALKNIDGGTATVDTSIQLRHDNEDDWESANPILKDGEIGLSFIDDYQSVGGIKIKIGDGSSTWDNLEYWVTDSYSPTGIQPISGMGVASALASSGFMTEVTSTDITTALGYTPYNGTTNPNNYISSASMSSLTDVSLTSLSNGQGLIYNSTSGKWENTAIQTSTSWGSITGTLSDQIDLNAALSSKQATITGAASSVTTSNLTASRALVSDSSGKIAVSSISSTKLGYLSDVTSNIQAQIDDKISSASLASLTDANISNPLNGNLIRYDLATSKWVNFALASTDITNALGYTPYSATNPNNYISSASVSTLTDVTLSSVTNGQFLKYDSTSSKWKNYSLTSTDITNLLGYTPYNASNPSGYISSASLASLTDTSISSPADGQHLVYDGTDGKWKNTNSSVSLNWGDIGGTLSDQTDLQTALNGKQATITGAASSVTASNLTASRVVVSDSSGKISASSISTTKLGYLSDVTSNIQTQLNGKLSSASLVGLTDTSISNPTQGQNLVYDATNAKWINASTSATVGWGGITGTLSDQTDLQNALDVIEAKIENVGVYRGTFEDMDSVPSSASGYLPDESGSTTPLQNDYIKVNSTEEIEYYAWETPEGVSFSYIYTQSNTASGYLPLYTKNSETGEITLAGEENYACIEANLYYGVMWVTDYIITRNSTLDETGKYYWTISIEEEGQTLTVDGYTTVETGFISSLQGTYEDEPFNLFDGTQWWGYSDGSTIKAFNGERTAQNTWAYAPSENITTTGNTPFIYKYNGTWAIDGKSGWTQEYSLGTAITVDQTYDATSTNAQSGVAVAEAIAGLTASNITTALGYTPENQANKVTTISGASTDVQYPSAKCIYDNFGSYIFPSITSNVTLVGTPTLNNGVLSGFSTSNYAKLPEIFPSTLSSQDWEFVIPFIATSLSSKQNPMCSDDYGIGFCINTNGTLSWYISSNGSSWNIANGTSSTLTVQANTQYYFKLGRTSGTTYLAVSTNKDNYTNYLTTNTSFSLQNTHFKFGISRSNSDPATYGSIDLKDSYINVNGERWWSGTTAPIAPALSGFEQTTNKVTSISSSSTDTQYPSAKAVYDQLALKQDTIDSSNKLSADLVDDTSTTNKFATAAQLSQISTNASDITTINGLIPSQATTSNPLADREFVNSSISTNTANFIGTFETVSDLNSYSGTVTNNDYAFVVNSVVTDNGNDWTNTTALNAYDKTLLTNFDYAWVVNGSNFDLYRFDIVNQTWNLRVQNTAKADVTLNIAYNRYKATVSGSTVTWAYEYTLNNSSFTASQWAAINSGITSSDVSLIGTALQPNDNISSLTNDSGYISGITSSMVTTALGYTPYNGSTNPNGYISSASMSALTDVTLTSLADGQIISYNSTTQKWENTTPSGSSVLEVINITVGLNTSTFVPETFTWSIQNPYGTISALNANGKVAYAFAEVMFGQVKVNDTYMLQVVNGSSSNDSLIFQCMIGSDEIGIVTLNSSNVTTMAIYNLGDFVSSLSDLGIIATATELNYVNGVTSNIQTQLDSKKVTFRDWS